MCCKLEGEAGRLELEAALGALGEVASWKHLAGQQWQHRCCEHGRYNRTVINWYASTGTIVCQGKQGKVFEQHLERALCGMPPMEVDTSALHEEKPSPAPAAKAKGLAACAKKGARPSGSGRLACACRTKLDAALDVVGERPSWKQLGGTQQQHICRQFGRYDKTVVNWYEGTGRIVCQGLNSAALELHLERALRNVPIAPSMPARRPEPALPTQQSFATCFFIGTPAQSQCTPVSKTSFDDNSVPDNTSTRTPSDESSPTAKDIDDSEVSMAAPTQVRLLAQQFNERMKESRATVRQEAFPFPYPHHGLVEKLGMTRSASAPSCFTAPLHASVAAIPEPPLQKAVLRSRSCAPKREMEAC